MGEVTRTTATVLVTDLVASTALRVRLGEEAADALRRSHDRLLGEAVEAAGGVVVKGSGDGILARFQSAADGLDAAVAAQRSLANFSRSRPPSEQLHIRIGLSVGDVSLEAGDCFGTPVVEAARLEAAASGGQILCTELVQLMARGRGRHTITAMGFLDLKGLPDPVAVCEVSWQTPDHTEHYELPPEVRIEAAKSFAGRTEALREGLAFIGDRSRARLGVIWLAGEPGIGKTRLAAEIAARAHEGGARVLFGRCNEDLHVAYQPFMEALRAFSEEVPDDLLPAALGEGAGRLSLLAPELGTRHPQLVAPARGDPDTDQYELFEAVRRWLAVASADHPLIVVIDDVQWASPPTRALLEHVARSAAASGAVLLCTARNTAPDDSEATRALLEGLRRRGLLLMRTLGGLEPADVAALVGGDELARELHAQTEGHPLFLEAIRAGGSDVTNTVQRRLATLSESTRDLLGVAALSGLSFELSVVARAAALDHPSALAAVETALACGLLQEIGANNFLFSHALFRSTLIDTMSRTRRASLHAALSRALEAELDDDGEEMGRAAQILHHELSAGPAGMADRIERFGRAAAISALKVFAFDEAARHFGVLVATSTDPAVQLQARLDQAAALLRDPDFVAAQQVFGEAAHQAAQLGDVGAEVTASLGFEDAGWRPGLPGASAVEVIDAALTHHVQLSEATLVRLQASKARALVFMGRGAQAAALADAALDRARRCGDPAALAHALLCRIMVFGHGPEIEQVEVLGSELAQLAHDLGDDELATHGADFSMAAIHRHSAVEFDRAVARLASMAERRRDVVYQHHIVTSFNIFQAFRDGQLARVEELISFAADPDRSSWQEPAGLYGLRMFLLRREQCCLAEVAPSLDLMTRLQPDAALWAPGFALLCAELGRIPQARAVLRALAAGGFAAVAHDGNRLTNILFLAETCWLLGAVDEAEWAIKHLKHYRGQIPMVWGSGLLLGPADRQLGLLYVLRGDRVLGVELLEQAVELSTHIGSVLWRARSLCDLGHVAGRTAALTEALELARAHDLPAVRRLAADRLAAR
ncbi:MAG: ATP-binding protein [Acidimicrobiales bacterium]